MGRSLQSLLAGLLAVLVATTPVLADQFTVSDIEVEGLQRVSAGTVFSAFPVSIGESVDELELAGAIKDLFRTGLFTDIGARPDKNVLVLAGGEAPLITSIKIEGNQNIETAMLKDAVANAGL